MAELKNLIVEGDTRLIGDTNAGNITATSIKTSGGTASQFVKGDGTLDNNAYTPLINTSSTFDFSSTTPTPGIYRVYGITNPANSQTEYGSVISTQNTGSTGSVTAQMIISGPASQSNPAHAYLRRLTDTGWTPWSTLLDNNNYTSYLPMIPGTGTSSVVQRGGSNTASGNYSHAEGAYTLAQNQSEHAQGQFNSSHKANTTFGNAGNTIHSIGIGTGSSNGKNAVEVMQNGDVYVYGVGGYTGTNYSSSRTLQNSLPYIIEADYSDLGSGAQVPTTLFKDIFAGRCLGLMVWNEPDADGDFYTFGHVDWNNGEIQFYYRYFNGGDIVTRKILMNEAGEILEYSQNTTTGRRDWTEYPASGGPGGDEEILEEPEEIPLEEAVQEAPEVPEEN